jgi:flagellar biosynthesis protein
LIRLLADKEPVKSEQLRRAVDDIESAQVDSLAAQSRGELTFSMVLPFADANPVEIKFFRPPRRPGQQKPAFSVDIHTENDELGEIWLKTSVTEAAHVDLMMWALKESVVRLAKRHSNALSERLSLAGLTMDSFNIFHSARPSLPDNWAPYGSRAAPVVTAKGRDELAEAIIAEAKRQGIYITEDRELVAALSRLDLEQEIPRDLYVAVAVVLSWAYWLRGMKPGDEKS